MNLNFKLVEPGNRADLEPNISLAPNYSIFHSIEWANVLKKTYNYKPYYLLISDSIKTLAFIPLMEVKNIFRRKNGISVPFADFCEPILLSNEEQSSIFKLIFDFAKKRGWRTVEFRGTVNKQFDTRPTIEFFHHSIDLRKSEEQIFNSFTKMTQRNVNKSQKCKLRYEISNSIDSIKKYYKIHCNTRKYLGVPPQPLKFFINIFEFILRQHQGFVILAYDNDLVIAGQIYFIYNNKAIFKYGASLKKYQNKKPNNFLMWEAIKWLKKNKIKQLSLGRTDICHEGLRKFKKGWGTEESKLSYYSYDLEGNNFINSTSKNSFWFSKFFQFFPIPLLRFIGAIAYKYMA